MKKNQMEIYKPRMNSIIKSCNKNDAKRSFRMKETFMRACG